MTRDEFVLRLTDYRFGATGSREAIHRIFTRYAEALGATPQMACQLATQLQNDHHDTIVNNTNSYLMADLIEKAVHA